MDNAHPKAALSRAIKAAGGASKLAAGLGVHRTAPHFWLKTKLPAERVRAVSAASGVPPHELRPDLFDKPQAAKVRSLHPASTCS